MSKKHNSEFDKDFSDPEDLDVSQEVVSDELEEEDELFDSNEAQQTIQSLQKELKAAEEKADKQWEIALRAKAEAENARRRASVDVEKAHKYSTDKLLKELLAVYDSLEQGLTNISEGEQDNNPVKEGMNLTLKMLLSVLENHGVELINPQGEKFNPEYHEAISIQENKDEKPGVVMIVIQQGFKLHGRLLRPARVIVSK